MVSRIMALKDVHVVIPGGCEYVMIHTEEELRLQVELSLLISLSARKIIMDYLDGTSVATRFLKSGRGRLRESN